mgnify:CR=1 FL=1
MKCNWLTVICTNVICDLGLADEVGSPSRQESIGVGTGAVLGGSVGGPVGSILGAALGSWLGELFVTFATTETYPLVVYFYSGFMNIFVPSAGSKWLIEAPYLLPAA